MLCGLETEGEGWAADFMGVTEGFRAEYDGADDCCCAFGFGLGRADSLLTRTDAGTCDRNQLSSWLSATQKLTIQMQQLFNTKP